MIRVVMASLLFSACGMDHAPLDPPDSDPGAEVVDVFRENCARCHGPNGEGTDVAPQIQSPVRAYATFVVRNGRADQMGFGGAMPSFAAADLPDLDAIFAWLDRPPHPTGGQALYVRYCANCHGADAQGGRVEQGVTHEAREGSDEISEKVRDGHGGANYGARTKYMPAWTTGELSDADVAAIASYLVTLPPGPHDGDEDD